MRHHILAYFNTKTEEIEHLASSDAPIAMNPVVPENMHEIDLHFLNFEKIIEDGILMRAERLLPIMEVKDGQLGFKPDHSINDEIKIIPL